MVALSLPRINIHIGRPLSPQWLRAPANAPFTRANYARTYAEPRVLVCAGLACICPTVCVLCCATTAATAAAAATSMAAGNNGPPQRINGTRIYHGESWRFGDKIPLCIDRHPIAAEADCVRVNERVCRSWSVCACVLRWCSRAFCHGAVEQTWAPPAAFWQSCWKRSRYSFTAPVVLSCKGCEMHLAHSGCELLTGSLFYAL